MMTGEEIRRMLAERIRVHERRTERWKHEAARTPEEQTVEAPLLPEEMCENEAERHEWRAEALAFIRDHVEPNECTGSVKETSNLPSFYQKSLAGLNRKSMRSVRRSGSTWTACRSRSAG